MRPRVLCESARLGLADLRVVYSPASWGVGWCGRGVAQVLFFGYVGVLSGVPGQAAYMAVGNTVLLVAISGLLAVMTTGWERAEGTLPFVVAGGGSVALGLLGRSCQHLVAGIPAALVAGAAALAVFPPDGLSWGGVALAVPLLLAVGLSSVALGLFLGGTLIRVKTGRNVVSNLTFTLMMLLCGVNVPPDALPFGLERLAAALPVTHALEAAREVLAGGPPAAALRGFLLELLVALGWSALAVAMLRSSLYAARRSGSLDWMY